MKKIKVLVIGIVTINLVFNTIYANSIAGYQNEINNIKKKLEQNNSTMNGIDKEVNELRLEILNLNSQIQSQNKDLEDINKKVDEMQKLIEKNQKELTTATSSEAGAEDLLQTRLRAIYENGVTNPWEMMFTSDNFMDFMAKKRVVSAITEYDRNLTESMKSQKEYHNNLQKEIESQKMQLDQLTYDREKTAKTLEMAKSNKENMTAKLNKDKNLLEAANKQLRKEEAECSNKIQEELAKMQDVNIVSEKGFLWPFPGGGVVTAGFPNYPASFGGGRHDGIDIAPRGAKNLSVVATKTGVVTKVVTGMSNTYPYTYSYGNYVIVSHGNNQATLYAHLNSVNVKKGQYVSQGQQIGILGNTGYSTGPHLHFEVRIKGVPQNPLSYVKNK